MSTLVSERPKTTPSLQQQRQQPGLIHLQNKDDLMVSMSNLNALFSKAVAIEQRESVDLDSLDFNKASSRVKSPAHQNPSAKQEVLSPDVKYHQRATRLMAHDGKLLQRLLRLEAIQHALRCSGIQVQDLVYRPRASFEYEPQRAWKVPPDIATLRFQAFEAQRLEYLVLLLSKAGAPGATNNVSDSVNVRPKDNHRTTNDDDVPKVQVRHKLQRQFQDQMQCEALRLAQIQHNRQKFERVAEREERAFRHERREFELRQRLRAGRVRKYEHRKLQRSLEVQAKHKAKESHVKKVKLQKELLDQTKVEMIKTRNRYIESTTKDTEEQRERFRCRHAQEREKERKRQEIFLEARVAESKRVKALEEQMQKKRLHIQQKSEELQRQKALEIEKKRLQQQKKAAYVARMNRARENVNQRAIDENARAKEQKHMMKDLHMSIFDARGKSKKKQIIAQDAWKDSFQQESRLPGPGEYEVSSTLCQAAGGTWGKYRPKSDIEWKMRWAMELPGPGEYKLKSLMASDMKGGSFSKQPLKTHTQEMMEQSQDMPGPGQYRAKAISTSAAVKFSNTQSTSELDRQLRRARETPGPADYAEPNIPRPKPQLREAKARIWNLVKVKAEESEMRARASFSEAEQEAFFLPSPQGSRKSRSKSKESIAKRESMPELEASGIRFINNEQQVDTSTLIEIETSAVDPGTTVETDMTELHFTPAPDLEEQSSVDMKINTPISSSGYEDEDFDTTTTPSPALITIPKIPISSSEYEDEDFDTTTTPTPASITSPTSGYEDEDFDTTTTPYPASITVPKIPISSSGYEDEEFDTTTTPSPASITIPTTPISSSRYEDEDFDTTTTPSPVDDYEDEFSDE